MERFEFPYIGLIFLALLMIPNLVWTKKKPKGYAADNENKVLLFLERWGEGLTCCCALLFPEFNIHSWTNRSWWLVFAFVLMALYEIWWIRYFRSKRELKDFYSSFLGIPVAGATLPVLAFFLLGIYGKVIFMEISVVILGIGHIGIHMQHAKETASIS